MIIIDLAVSRGELREEKERNERLEVELCTVTREAKALRYRYTQQIVAFIMQSNYLLLSSQLNRSDSLSEMRSYCTAVDANITGNQMQSCTE